MLFAIYWIFAIIVTGVLFALKVAGVATIGWGTVFVAVWVPLCIEATYLFMRLLWRSMS